MLQKYHHHAKMPKEWVHVKAEEEDKERMDDVEEVWRKQREALSTFTILGRCVQLGHNAVSPSLSMNSAAILNTTTSPSVS